MQIGHVAERAGLSLRTIRYYEEEGLVIPATRSAGGFRLYTEADCERLQLIKQMKPLSFSLDEIRELLHILDQLGTGARHEVDGPLVGRLHDFAQISEERCEKLRKQLAASASFAEMLKKKLKQASARGA
ncbi:MAG: MerR family transcriptional regulator [Thermoleophilia bacterium]|nr:MerR family transcriptional regulator [Thermoleophilia bacterium]